MTKMITALLLGILCFTNIGCGRDDQAERDRQNFNDSMDKLDNAFEDAGVD